MSNALSTITSKWQVTIPEEVRKELPFKVGQRIAWEIAGETIIGRRVRSIRELSGCLKRGGKGSGSKDLENGFAKAVVARHDRISRQKP